MNRVLFVFLVSLLTWADVSRAVKPSPWTVYYPAGLVDETGRPAKIPTRPASIPKGKGYVQLIYAGEDGWGRPIQVERRLDPSRHVIELSDTLGLFAISSDSTWTEQLSSDHFRVGFIPFVVVHDTTRSLTPTYWYAQSPRWANSQPRLAFTRSRVSIVSGNQYPPSPDSILFFDFGSGTSFSYPVPATTLSWSPYGDILASTEGTAAYRVEVPGGVTTAHRGPAGAVSSAKGQYAYQELPHSQQMKMWSAGVEMRPHDAITRGIANKKIAVKGAPFWVRDPRNDGLLCFGIMWRKRISPKRKPGSKACEVIVYDVGREKIVRRIPGGMVGPAAGRAGVFYFRDGRINYASLTGP